MQAVAFLTQSDPARAEWTILTRGDYLSCVVIRGIRHAIDDFELAGRTRRLCLSDCHRKSCNDGVSLKHRQLAIGNADQDRSLQSANDGLRILR